MSGTQGVSAGGIAASAGGIAASAGGIAASAGGVAASAGGIAGAMSSTTLIIIGVILFVLIVGLIMYLRSSGKDSKSSRADDIREELRLRRELREIEK